MGRQRKFNTAGWIHQAVPIYTYADLLKEVDYCLAGRHNLMIHGRQGLCKSYVIKDMLRRKQISFEYLEGSATGRGLYEVGARQPDSVIVCDDMETLLSDDDYFRVMRAMTNTVPEKLITWSICSGRLPDDVPPKYLFFGRFITIANQWIFEGPRYESLLDRFHCIDFRPSNVEVHKYVGTWFWQQNVFDFIASYLNFVPHISVRAYTQGSERIDAGDPDWERWLLSKMLHDEDQKAMARVLADKHLKTMAAKQKEWSRLTGQKRASFYRVKKEFPKPVQIPKIMLTKPHPYKQAAKSKKGDAESLKIKHTTKIKTRTRSGTKRKNGTDKELVVPLFEEVRRTG